MRVSVGWHGKCVCLTRKVDMLVSQVWPTSAKRKWIWLARLLASACNYFDVFRLVQSTENTRVRGSSRWSIYCFRAITNVSYILHVRTLDFCTAILSAWLSPSLKVDVATASLINKGSPHRLAMAGELSSLVLLVLGSCMLVGGQTSCSLSCNK